tara:strand:- start:127 stop:753 length:627 start_codon:yes stop_codon:yes gene_type:complete
MKKIISILIASLFLSCSAYAGGVIGVKVGQGELDGKRTVDPSHGITTKASGSVSSEYAAIFAEFGTDKFSLGVEYVPIDAVIDTKAATATDTHATISDFTTVYALIPFGGDGVYGKIGYAHADLGVSANYDTVTVGSHSGSLEGVVLGLGVNIASNLPFADVLRIEGNFVEFDEVSITTTNTNGTADTHTKKGEAELMTISLSIAKSF